MIPDASSSVGTGTTKIHWDLLEVYRTEMGISNTDRVTAMRIIGRLELLDLGTSTAIDYFAYQVGIAWVSGPVATASAGSTNIPQPLNSGVRETQWLWQGNLMGLSANTTGQILPAAGTNARQDWALDFDITQMRKQPTQDSKLVLIGNGSVSGSADIGLIGYFNTLIALS